MAADILLYSATHVPVGDDQKQHLELARDIAHKFNTDYKKEIFALPVPLMNQSSARIMSLRDGTKKMSKSDISEYSRILMTDSNDQITTKIKKAKTDSMNMPMDLNEAEKRPEINNLLNIYCACTNRKKDEIISNFSGKEISLFKKSFTKELFTANDHNTTKTKVLLNYEK